MLTNEFNEVTYLGEFPTGSAGRHDGNRMTRQRLDDGRERQRDDGRSWRVYDFYVRSGMNLRIPTRRFVNFL